MFSPISMRRPAILFLALAGALFIFGFAIPRPAHAAGVVVGEVAGAARAVSPDGRTTALARGQTIDSGQTIETGPDGRVILNLPDGSRLEMAEESHLEVNKIVGEGDSDFSFSMLLGYVHLKLKKMLAPEMVVTPTMIAGVRGTEFGVSVADDGASVVSVADGAVDVSSEGESENGKELKVEAGQEVQAGEPGQDLKSRPRQIRSPQEARKFIRAHLDEIIPRLPQITEKIEKGIDPALTRLAKAKNRIDQLSGKLRTQAEKMQAAGPPKDMEKRKTALKMMGKEAAELFKALKFFRSQAMRLRAMMARAVQFKQILPKIKDRLGSNYETVSQRVDRITGRIPEIKPQVQSLAQAVNQDMEQIKPFLMKLREARAEAGMPPPHRSNESSDQSGRNPGKAGGAKAGGLGQHPLGEKSPRTGAESN